MVTIHIISCCMFFYCITNTGGVCHYLITAKYMSTSPTQLLSPRKGTEASNCPQSVSLYSKEEFRWIKVLQNYIPLINKIKYFSKFETLLPINSNRSLKLYAVCQPLPIEKFRKCQYIQITYDMRNQANSIIVRWHLFICYYPYVISVYHRQERVQNHFPPARKHE